MLAGNSSLRRRLRFMPGDFKYQETKAPPLKDAYDEFLARIICYVFSVSPEPFVSHVNRATAQVSQKRGTDEGLAPLQRYVSGSINRIIAEEFDSPDLEFAWRDGVEQDPAEAAKINVAYVQAGILSAAEVRQSLGLERGSLEKGNPYHKPAGAPEGKGGEFDFAAGGSSSGTTYPDDRAEESYALESGILSLASGIAGRVISMVRLLASALEDAFASVGEATVSEDSAADIKDILMPNGERIGSAGSNEAIREIKGSAEDAQKFFDRLTRGAEIIKPKTSYNGTFVKLPDGGIVGIRFQGGYRSQSNSATIDVAIPELPVEKNKI